MQYELFMRVCVSLSVLSLGSQLAEVSRLQVPIVEELYLFLQALSLDPCIAYCPSKRTLNS